MLKCLLYWLQTLIIGYMKTEQPATTLNARIQQLLKQGMTQQAAFNQAVKEAYARRNNG